MLIIDNAKNLNNVVVDGLCEQFKIRYQNFAIYKSQMNGLVEIANKNLKKIICKMTETYRNWHEKLPYVLMVHRTAIKTSTRATSYSLMYGINPSLCILMKIQLEEIEWINQRHEQLVIAD